MSSNSRRDFLKLSVFAGGGILTGSQKAGANDAAPGEIREPARSIPVFAEADVCVLGGSCTGVFAAIRAARLGAKVVLIEKQNSFGGTATNSMVNMNQTGEAAGTAAYLAINTNTPIPKLNPAKVRKTLSKKGSIII